MAPKGESTESAISRTLEWLAGPRYFDERVQHWPLVSWQAAVSLTLLYLGGVWLAQKWMARQQPYNVRSFAITHNLVMALLSLYMVVETLEQTYISCGWEKKFRLWGQMAEPGEAFTPAGARLANVLWIHYLSKAYEWVDTFIMVAKKNNRQITFLHLYHHASTFLTWWLIINFSPGGDSYFLCAINSFVHVFMYTYYFVSSAGMLKVPQAIKQAITLLQLAQFAVIVTGTLYIMILVPDFRPRFGIPLTCLQAVIFISLFSDFFVTAYRQKEKKAKKAKAAAVTRSAASYTPVAEAYAQQDPPPLENGRFPNGYSHLAGTYKPLPGQKPGARPSTHHLTNRGVAA